MPITRKVRNKELRETDDNDEPIDSAVYVLISDPPRYTDFTRKQQPTVRPVKDLATTPATAATGYEEFGVAGIEAAGGEEAVAPATEATHTDEKDESSAKTIGIEPLLEPSVGRGLVLEERFSKADGKSWTRKAHLSSHQLGEMVADMLKRCGNMLPERDVRVSAPR